MKPFKRGLKLPDFKYASLSSLKIHRLPPPRFVTVRLDQHPGAVLRPCVREGELVGVGTQIAHGTEPISVPLHSSASGRVHEIGHGFIRIESDEADSRDSSIRPNDVPASDTERFVELLRQAGIVDLARNPSPLHWQLLQARARGIHTVIVNGCESEPFLTCDHLLMLNHPVEILKGTEMLRNASGARQAIIAVEANKLEVVELLNSKNYALKIKMVKAQTLPTRYPQGAPRTLARTITGLWAGSDEDLIRIGVLVVNVATAFSVYEAAALGKPLYERVVTVSGPCVLEPKNLWVRIGTPVGDLIRAAKGFMRPPERIILGGPLTGDAIESLEEPVVKKTQAVLALPPELTHSGREEPCIRCGWCLQVCPESLFPETIVRAVRKENLELAGQYEIERCTECGCCAYICPSKIPIVSIIQKAKNKPAPNVSIPQPLDALPV